VNFRRYHATSLLVAAMGMTVRLCSAMGADQDHLAVASQNGFLKVVVTKDGVFAASWRGDVVWVDPNKPEMTKQIPLDYTAFERDMFSFDVTPTGVMATETLAQFGYTHKNLLLLPLSDMKSEPLAKQPLIRDQAHIEDHPVVKYQHGIIDHPYGVMPEGREASNTPLPFTDLSSCADGLSASFAYEGNFYIWEFSEHATKGSGWELRYKLPAVTTTGFLCHRAGNSYRLLSMDGRRYQVEEVQPAVVREIERTVDGDGNPYKLTDHQFVAIDANGKHVANAGSQTSPATKPVATMPATRGVLVMDRTGEVPSGYRLLWRDGALHPEPDDHDKAHAQVAIVATKAIDVLGTAPSVAMDEKYRICIACFHVKNATFL